MFIDDISIGFAPKDAESARVVSAALGASGTCPPPIFEEPEGPFVRVRFAEPQGLPSLYGWMERISGDQLLHLAEAEPSIRYNKSETVDDTTMTTTTRVSGEVSFLLHLWSTPHSSRAAAGVEDASTPEAPKLFAADGAPLSGPSVSMELRDDTTHIHNAVDTVIHYGQALERNPHAKEVVHVDSSTGQEYIQFV